MTRQNPQNGFAAIAAIFLIVVLAALAGYMVSISNAQQASSAQDVQGSRAYWAARAGLEWGFASVTTASACPAASTTLPIEDFTVVIDCRSQAYSEAGLTPVLFQLTAVASMGTVGSVGFIERSVSASLEK